MAKKLRGLPSIDDDGLPAQEVGAWALEKYRRVFYYDQLFSPGMKNRFDQRVYIDLFAGAGMSRIRGTPRSAAETPSSASASWILFRSSSIWR